MTNEDLKQLLSQLHQEVTYSLLQKIKNGEASSMDYKNAITLLKQNNIQIDLSTEENNSKYQSKSPELQEDLSQILEDKDSDNDYQDVYKRIN